MNGIAASAPRRVDFIHVPAPKQATSSFFAPLRDWRAPKETRLYLGLLQEDDHAGNLVRISSACTAVRDFGVAAECGFGRRDPSHVPAILATHRDAAETLAR